MRFDWLKLCVYHSHVIKTQSLPGFLTRMQLLWSSINRKVRNCDFKLCSLTHSLPVTYIYKSRIKETSKVIIDSAYDSTAAILYSIAVTVCIYINKVQCQSVCLSVCLSVCSTLETLFLKLFENFFFIFQNKRSGVFQLNQNLNILSSF